MIPTATWLKMTEECKEKCLICFSLLKKRKCRIELHPWSSLSYRYGTEKELRTNKSKLISRWWMSCFSIYTVFIYQTLWTKSMILSWTWLRSEIYCSSLTSAHEYNNKLTTLFFKIRSKISCPEFQDFKTALWCSEQIDTVKLFSDITLVPLLTLARCSTFQPILVCLANVLWGKRRSFRRKEKRTLDSKMRLIIHLQYSA